MRGAGGRAARRWRSLPVAARDAGFAALLAAVSFLPSVAGAGAGLVVPAAGLGLDAAGVLLVLGQTLPLALRRRAPAWCVGLVSGCYFAQQLGGHPLHLSGAGLAIALFSAAAHQRRGRTTLAVALTLAYVGYVGALALRGSRVDLPDAVTFFGLFAAFWALGLWVRRQALKETARFRQEGELAVAQERARIARELHDVVTHHVTAIVVQAEAAAFAPADPAAGARTLQTIAGTGRQALVELRHQLGVLQPGAAADAVRAPALERVADIVERARASGQPVRLVEAGDPEQLAGPVGLAVRRVVQESLTNALKHAPAMDTTVTVERTSDAVEVDVETAGAPATRSRTLAPSGSGYGLTGLQERVGLLGGDLRAGPSDSGGFRVIARIPIPAS